MLDRLLRVNERIAHVAVWVGGALMIFSACMVTVDVLLRKFLSVTLGGADEISGYLFAIATVWAFSYAALHRVNVRIDALYTHLPRTLRAVLDLLGLVLLTGFVLLLTWRAALLFVDTVENWSRSITPLQTPLAIPQSLWLAGLLLFSFTLLLIMTACVAALLRGNLSTVQRLAGVRTVSEEVEEEKAAGADAGERPTAAGSPGRPRATVPDSDEGG